MGKRWLLVQISLHNEGQLYPELVGGLCLWDLNHLNQQNILEQDIFTETNGLDGKWILSRSSTHIKNS